MTAPVNLILEDCRRCLGVAFPDATVDINRARSLSDDQRELPCLNIKQGSVDPLAGGNTFESLSAALNLTVEIYDKGTDSKELIARLNEHAIRAHVALVPLGSVLLPFVPEVGWLGHGEPSTDAVGVDVSAQLDVKFQVAFNFDRDNPNVE